MRTVNLHAWYAMVDGDRFIVAAETDDGLWRLLEEEGLLTRRRVSVRELTEDELDKPLRVGGEDGSTDGPGSYDSSVRRELQLMCGPGLLAVPRWYL